MLNPNPRATTGTQYTGVAHVMVMTGKRIAGLVAVAVRCRSFPSTLAWAGGGEGPLGKQPFVASSTPTAVSSLPVLPPMIMVAAVSTSNEDQGMGTSGPETVSEIHPSSVIETPFTEYPRHCLYVRDLVLCRKNGEGRYLVDSALTINTTLADTGAGPSVVTTTLLASLPDDACISREEQEQKLDAIAGPDGSPLIPRGHVSLVFSISGVPFRL
mmetsp:Transcript_31757/g.101305  ORF Transcript_31757/g.101305 Transcript_31757/m.101305 type:complete len:214 (+) Transcript_31757:45-686(+)